MSFKITLKFIINDAQKSTKQTTIYYLHKLNNFINGQLCHILFFDKFYTIISKSLQN